MIIKQEKFGYIFLEQSCENINYLRNRIEEYVTEHLNRLEVQDKIIFYKKKEDFSSTKTGKFFFIVAKKNSYTIYQKKITVGYIYNFKLVHKICKYVLIENPKTKFINKKIGLIPYNEKAAQWAPIHNELIDSGKVQSVITDVIAGL